VISCKSRNRRNKNPQGSVPLQSKFLVRPIPWTLPERGETTRSNFKSSESVWTPKDQKVAYHYTLFFDRSGCPSWQSPILEDEQLAKAKSRTIRVLGLEGWGSRRALGQPFLLTIICLERVCVGFVGVSESSACTLSWTVSMRYRRD